MIRAGFEPIYVALLLNSFAGAWQQAHYAVDRHREGYSTRNAAQNLEVTFAPAEARLRSAFGVAAMRLVGYGYGDRLIEPQQAKLTGSGNRVEYRRGPLTEWYLNDQRGLEQGFTLATRPGQPGSGPLVVALGVSGGLQPQATSRYEAVLLDPAGRAVLRYAGLQAWDAERRLLPAYMEVSAREIRLLVDDNRAVYPVTIDPTVSAVILQASDGASADRLGSAVAVDGNIAVAGMPSRSGTQGAVQVYARSGSTWSQLTQLTASDGVRGDQFGASVSVSGNLIVIGAPGQASGRGAAYVFVQNGPNWIQQAELTAPDGNAGDSFGSSVSLNGATAVVGAPGRASGEGTVYVFTGTGGVWSPQAELTPNDGAAGDAFGHAVALSGDTIAAGAYAKNNFQGAAYVFFRSGGNWSQQAKLAATPLASDAEFGFGVAVNADTVIVGSNSKSFAPGNAYIFVRTGTTWNQQAHLMSPGDSGANAFAAAVAVNGDTVLCSETGDSQLFGEAYIFVRSGSNWTPQPKLTAPDGAIGDVFSSAVALSSDTAFFGSPNKSNSEGGAYAFTRSGVTFAQPQVLAAAGGTNSDAFGGAIAVSGDTVMVGAASKASGQGAAYVFVPLGGGWVQQNKLTPLDPAVNDGFGASIATDGNTALIGASGKGGQGAAYVFVRNDTNWTQQAKLVASDLALNDHFGTSVSLNGDTAVIGANGRLSNQGVAYVFVRTSGAWTQQAKLSASDAASNDGFGTSVAVSGDTVVVGARSKNSFQGAAYVFVRSAGIWTQQAKLVPDAAGSDNFGYAVSIDGASILVGAYLDAARNGAAYVFTNSGTAWAQQAKLTRPNSAAGVAGFGLAVSLSGDTAIVGDPLLGAGAASVFTRSGSAWTQVYQLAPPDGASGDSFGSAVGVSGATLVASSPSKAGGEGEAYVFPLPVIAPSGVWNTVSSQPTFAPGSLATVSGNHFSNVDTPNGDPPWQTVLNNVSVQVDGMNAAMSFAGYQQIMFQIPYETSTGPATVVVSVNGASSMPAQITVSDVAPAVFTTPDGRAMVINDDGNMNSEDDPANDEGMITILCAGLGLLDNPIPDGAAAPGDPPSNALITPTVSIGGADAPVTSATMVAGLVGVAQIVAQVPDLPAGDYPVVITQENVSSNGPIMSVSGTVVGSSSATRAGAKVRTRQSR